MNSHNIKFHDKIKKMSSNICIMELFHLDSKTGSNEPSVFKLLRLDCILVQKRAISGAVL